MERKKSLISFPQRRRLQQWGGVPQIPFSPSPLPGLPYTFHSHFPLTSPCSLHLRPQATHRVGWYSLSREFAQTTPHTYYFTHSSLLHTHLKAPLHATFLLVLTSSFSLQISSILALSLPLEALSSPFPSPNHLLVNEYEVGEGIARHKGTLSQHGRSCV